jgi:hypothetical protein
MRLWNRNWEKGREAGVAPKSTHVKQIGQEIGQRLQSKRKSARPKVDH